MNEYSKENEMYSREWTAADEWFDTSLLTFQKVVFSNLSHHSSPIKVAVLDSGVDRSDPHLKFESSVNETDPPKKEFRLINEIAIHEKNCRGFPPSLKPLEDECGHGTQCAVALLRTAPYVELYVGRIMQREMRISTDNEYTATAQVTRIVIHTEMKNNKGD